MVTNIIQIGNSKGIILPSEILKQLRLSLNFVVFFFLFFLEIGCEHFFGREQYCDKGTTTAGMGGSCQTCP